MRLCNPTRFGMILSFLKRAVNFGENENFKKGDGVEEGEEAIPVVDEELKFAVYDLIKTIKDPEKPSTLEDLLVVYEDGVKVLPSQNGNGTPFIVVEFTPTVPHCSLATLIGLCIRMKLERGLPHPLKLDIHIKKGTHDTEEEINKQINDKERIAAAMENPNLKELVEGCIVEDY